MKSEIERINAQTVTKADIDALQKTVKKHFEGSPEDTHEPKGKRGRPKSAKTTEGASSSSQAPVKKEPDSAASSSQSPKKEPWNATLWDAKTGKTYWDKKSNDYIVNQLRLRGFDNDSKWQQIKKLTKDGLLKIVMELIVNDKW